MCGTKSDDPAILRQFGPAVADDPDFWTCASRTGVVCLNTVGTTCSALLRAIGRPNAEAGSARLILQRIEISSENLTLASKTSYKKEVRVFFTNFDHEYPRNHGREYVLRHAGQ
jgi:hypothetical protein